VNHSDPNLNSKAASATDDEHWWPRLVDHINTWWMDRQPTGPALRQALRIPPKPTAALILITSAGALAMVAALLYWLIVASSPSWSASPPASGTPPRPARTASPPGD